MVEARPEESRRGAGLPAQLREFLSQIKIRKSQAITSEGLSPKFEQVEEMGRISLRGTWNPSLPEGF